MNFSAPVEAGTLKLRNWGFAYKSDFDAQKLPKLMPKGCQNGFKNQPKIHLKNQCLFDGLWGRFWNTLGSELQ